MVCSLFTCCLGLIYLIFIIQLSALREGGRLHYSLIRFVWSFRADAGKSVNSGTWLSSSSLFNGLISKSEGQFSFQQSEDQQRAQLF